MQSAMNTKNPLDKIARYFTSEKAVVLAAVFLAVAFSLLLTSGNSMLLFLIAGALMGVFLFGKPVACFWVLFFSVFLMGGLISQFPRVTTMRWGVVLLSLVLGGRAFLEFVVPGKYSEGLKFDRLLVVVLVLIFIGIISSLINGISLSNIAVALKNYFQFIPVMFALAILPHFKHQSMIKRITTGLLIVAVIQVPVALYQKFILGAQTISAGLSTVAVQDAVSGTFANSIRGGASGVLSLFLIFVVGMIASFAKNKIISLRKAIFTSLILLVPIVFNETKASFVYIPVVFAVLFRKEILRLKLKGIVSLVLCVSVFLSLGYLYKALYTTSDKDFEGYINGSLEYNIGERGYGMYRLNRSTVLRFWMEERKNYDLTSLMIGHGLDAANEAGGGAFAGIGHMAARYPLYGIGLTMASKLLWETGVAGLISFFAILVIAFIKISCFLKDNDGPIPTFHRSVLLALQVGIALCTIESFVSAAFRSQEVYNFLVSLILGLSLLMTQPPMRQQK